MKKKSKKNTNRRRTGPSANGPNCRPNSGSKSSWHLYVIRTENDYLYTGITTDIDRRFKEHCNSKKGARFFRAHKPAEIVFRKKIGTRSDALKAEYAFKQLSRKEKLASIARSGLPTCRICRRCTGRSRTTPTAAAPAIPKLNPKKRAAPPAPPQSQHRR